MDELQFKQLLQKLDNALNNANEMLTKFSPSPSPAEQNSVGMITKDTDLKLVPKKQLPLIHAMLHNFSCNKSGKELNKKSIESLHRKLVKLLDSHERFDKLDDTI